MSILHQMQADYLKALAHPTRIRILEHMRGQNSVCVCTFIEDLELDQSNISQHLRVLRKAGIVTSKKEGLKVYYRPVTQEVYQLIDMLNPLLKKQLETMSKALFVEG